MVILGGEFLICCFVVNKIDDLSKVINICNYDTLVLILITKDWEINVLDISILQMLS